MRLSLLLPHFHLLVSIMIGELSLPSTEKGETEASTAASSDDERVLTVRGLSGEVLCTLPAAAFPDMSQWKVHDLCQQIEARTGIPALVQKLLVGDKELSRLDHLGELAVTCITEITLLRRSNEIHEWITRVQKSGMEGLRHAPEHVRQDRFFCLMALSLEKEDAWRFIPGELLHDEEFLAEALHQDKNMFKHTRCLSTNMNFLTGCAKLRASGRMNWGSNGPVRAWSYS